MSSKNILVMVLDVEVKPVIVRSIVEKFVAKDDYMMIHESWLGNNSCVLDIASGVGSVAVQLTGTIGKEVYELLNFAIVLSSHSPKSVSMANLLREKVVEFSIPVVVVYT
jgi:hypothetical protein